MDATSKGSVVRDARIASIVGSLLDYICDSTLSPNTRRHLILFLTLQNLLPNLGDGLVRLGISAIGASIGPISFIPDAMTFCALFTRLPPLIIAPILQYIKLEATDIEVMSNLFEGCLDIGLYSGSAFALRYGASLWTIFVGMRSTQTAIFLVLFLLFTVTLWSFLSIKIKGTYLCDGIRRSSKLAVHLLRCVISWVIEAIAATSRTSMKFYSRCESEVMEKMKWCIAEDIHARYQYCHFSQSREIRILRLLRRRPLTELHCELIHVSLDDVPQFEAISYTWRNEAATEKIIVNGCCAKVTPTIYEMLHYRNSFLGSKDMWIDSVCINQSDLEERSQQVQIMRDIYHLAFRVVVWLGPRNEALDAHLVPETLRFLENNQTSPADEIFNALLGNRKAGWCAILKLLNHVWFERIWVVQEVAVAENVHVMYGNICVGWDHFSSSLAPILSRNDLQKLIFAVGDTTGDLDRSLEHFLNANTMEHFRKTVQLECLMPLGDVLVRTLTFKSSDPRDKIFAIFGISVVDKSHGLVPDYRKSTAEVYLATMRYLISEGNAWHISYALQLAGIGFGPAAKIGNEKFPSWVANFTEELVGRVLWNGKGEDLYGNAQTGWNVNDMFTSNPHVLLLEAMEIDRIEYEAETYWVNNNSVSLMERGEQARRWLADAKSVLAQSMETPGSVPPKAWLLEEAFYRTLLGSETVDGSIDQKNYKGKYDRLLKAMEDMAHFGDKNSEEESSLNLIMDRCIGRRLCATVERRFAVVPPLTKKDDIICIFRGLWPHFILRKTQIREIVGCLPVFEFELVGSCYIQGVMEAQMEKLPWKSYRLR